MNRNTMKLRSNNPRTITSMQHHSRTARRRRKGATAVEFAVASVILFLLIFAAVEFTRMGMIRHSADNAAYEAARHVMVPGGTVEEAEQVAQRFLANTRIRNATVTVSPNPIREDSPLVTVEVEVPLEENAWGIAIFSRNKQIYASSTLHTERPPRIQAKALPTNPVPPSKPPVVKPPTNPNPPTITKPPKKPSKPTRPRPRPPQPPRPPAPRR